MRTALPLLLFAAASSAPIAAAEPVRVPSFHSVQLRGGGHVTIRPAAVQRVVLLSGSQSYTGFRVDGRGRLEISACNSRCPRNYRLEILIESPSLPDVGITGGGKISAANGFRGQRSLAAAISGGGQIDVRSVPANRISAAINGGGQILVRPRAKLAAVVNGGGSIRYWGNPQVSKVVNGGGSVVRAE